MPQIVKRALLSVLGVVVMLAYWSFTGAEAVLKSGASLPRYSTMTVTED